jgi:tetratricopeptide (TPR) repeat protein
MGWRKWWLRAAVHIGLIASLAGIYCAQAQSTNDPATLEAEVSRLYKQGKYVEATPLAERYVALARQRYGEEHGEFASSITWLANVYAARGRHAEAERLYKRSLAIREIGRGRRPRVNRHLA